jgi:hypothetical protein
MIEASNIRDRVVLKMLYELYEFINKFSGYCDTYNLFDIALINKLLRNPSNVENKERHEIVVKLKQLQSKNTNGLIVSGDEIVAREDRNHLSQETSEKLENSSIKRENNIHDAMRGDSEFLSSKLIDVLSITGGVLSNYAKDFNSMFHLTTDDPIYNVYSRLIIEAIFDFIKNKYSLKSYDVIKYEQFKIKSDVRMIVKYQYMRLQSINTIELYRKDEMHGGSYSQASLKNLSFNLHKHFFNHRRLVKEVQSSKKYSEHLGVVSHLIGIAKPEIMYMEQALSSKEIESLLQEKSIYLLPIIQSMK